MNSEERRSRRRELYRLRREGETTEERLARQREYMRHRRAGQTEQQTERILQLHGLHFNILGPRFDDSVNYSWLNNYCTASAKPNAKQPSTSPKLDIVYE